MTNRIGWIGLGRMGEVMVKRLLKAGHGTSVWNRTASKAQPLAEYGATIVARKLDLASCEVVFTMVSTTDDLKEVLFADLTGEGKDDAVVTVDSGGAAGIVAMYVFSAGPGSDLVKSGDADGLLADFADDGVLQSH